jgi:murein L,D-transpeptidase YcbB/YkuD
MLNRQKIILTLLVFALSACGKTESPGPSATKSTPKAVVQKLPADQLVAAIRKSHELVSDARRTHLGNLPDERKIAIENSGDFKRAVTLVYDQLGGGLFFFTPEESDAEFLIDKKLWSEDSWPALSEFLKEIPSHGLKPNDYKLSQLQQAHTNFSVAESSWNEGLGKLKESKDLTFLMGLLEQDALTENLETLLMNYGLSNKDLERITGFLTNYEETHAAHLDMIKHSVALDARMLRSLMQVLLDFRFIKRAHPFNPTRYPSKAANSYARQMAAILVVEEPSAEPEVDDSAPEKKKPLDLPAMPEELDARKDLQTFLSAQVPPFPLYQPMREAYQKYQDLAVLEAEKAPPTISRRATRLKHGRRGNQVVKLKKRLAFEGFLPVEEEYTDHYDDALKEALLLYQKTHQLKEIGEVTNGTVFSLNKSLEKRAKQLSLGLQRYRESDINWERPERYVRVNIAAFWAQVWDQGELKKQHRVVVGNNDMVKRFKAGVVGHLNRTRLFNAEITSIVMNPYWRVPARIKRLELDEELIDNPDFYERNRYEVDTSAAGVEIVRQTPGNHNALGRVKINFPNPHAIYMHDTPHKATFKHAVRSQSHGCMRLQDPLEMARFILESDNAYDAEKFQTMLDSLKEKTIPLSTPIRIFVEYNVTSIAEDGRPMFLSDIYKYDRAFFNRDLPVVERYQLAAYRDGRKIPYEDVVKVHQ